MKLTAYLAAHRYALVTQLAPIAVIDAVFLASGAADQWMPDFRYMNLLFLFFLLVGNGWGWIRERSRFGPLRRALDDRLPMDGLLPVGNGYHEALLRDTLDAAHEEWAAQLEAGRRNAEEMQDYILRWTHEIKMPLAISELVLDDLQPEVSRRLRVPLERTKFLVNQVLYVGRATHSQDDLIMRDVSLEKALRTALRANTAFFLDKDISVEMDPIPLTVLSDEKWTVYLFEQILHNASKYVPRGGSVTVCAQVHEKGVTVHVRDTGIGIPAGDIGRVFDKGFTGENGRTTERSTGMGLYYAKRMADRLGIGLEVSSERGKWTEFRVIFYRIGDWYDPMRRG